MSSEKGWEKANRLADRKNELDLMEDEINGQLLHHESEVIHLRKGLFSIMAERIVIHYQLDDLE